MTLGANFCKQFFAWITSELLTSLLHFMQWQKKNLVEVLASRGGALGIPLLESSSNPLFPSVNLPPGLNYLLKIEKLFVWCYSLLLLPIKNLVLAKFSVEGALGCSRGLGAAPTQLAQIGTLWSYCLRSRYSDLENNHWAYKVGHFINAVVSTC